MSCGKAFPMWREVVQNICRAMVVTCEGSSKPLSEKSQDFVRQVLVYTCMLAIDLQPHRTAETQSRVEQWLRNYHGSFDIWNFATFLKEVDGLFKEHMKKFELIPKGDGWSYERLKRSIPNKKHMRFLAVLKEPIDLFMKECDPYAFSLCNTWINFLGRCNLPGLDLTEQEEASYVKFEEEIKGWSYDQHLISDLKDIISEWFKHFDYHAFKPKHGSGAVATHSGRLPHFLKFLDCMRTDARLHHFLIQNFGSTEDWFPWGSSSFSDDIKEKFGITKLPLSRVSELLVVPKSPTKNRTISKEPAVLQYFQQGIFASLIDHIEHHWYLSQHIDIKNQEVSQLEAALGSRDSSLATLDLSAASDSVTLELVKGMFADCPALLEGLIATRSTHTQLKSGQVVKLLKFAPMGSATCFPIETIIFGACCELAIRRCAIQWRRERPQKELQWLSRTYPLETLHWRTYGDDIIISTDAAEYLLDILAALNFTVNKGKSFYNRGFKGIFREACGIECLDGIDVTPLRVPRFFTGIRRDMVKSADAVASAVSFANNIYKGNKYGWLHRCVREDFGDLWKRLPHSTSEDFGILTESSGCTNYGVAQRFELARSSKRVNYQRIEYAWDYLVSRQDCTHCLEWRNAVIRDFPYQKWLRKTECDPLSGKACEGCFIQRCKIHQSPAPDTGDERVGSTSTRETLRHHSRFEQWFDLVRYHYWLLDHADRKPNLSVALNHEERYRRWCQKWHTPVSPNEAMDSIVNGDYEANEPRVLCPVFLIVDRNSARSFRNYEWHYMPIGV